MQYSGYGRKAQASMLLALIIAIAMLVGWIYIKYLTVETFSRSVANTYDIESAMYRKRVVEAYIDTSSRLAYQMALSKISRSKEFSYVPFIINNKMKIPDENYFKGRLGEMTLDYANSFMSGIEKELDVKLEGFKCFDIEKKGDRMVVTLRGGRLKIEGDVYIDEELNVSFETSSAVFDLYRKNAGIMQKFMGKLKTACDMSTGCNQITVYDEVNNIAKELEKIAEEESSGDVVCRAGIEKAFVQPYSSDTWCRTEGSCRLMEKNEEFLPAVGYCEPIPFSFPYTGEKGYLSYKAPNFNECYKYKKAIIEFEISLVCRKKGEFVFDDEEKGYRELEFGSSYWSKADSEYACSSRGDIKPSGKLKEIIGGKCICRNECVICGQSYESYRECGCTTITDDEGIIVAGKGFPGDMENRKRFVAKYVDGCKNLDPNDFENWPQECIDKANNLAAGDAICSITCSPSPKPIERS